MFAPGATAAKRAWGFGKHPGSAPKLIGVKVRGPLEPGEYALVATRAHGVQLLPALVWVFLALVGWNFSSALWGLRPWLAYLALAVALFCLYRGLGRAVGWLSTSYLLTSHRLVVRQGLTGRADVRIPLDTLEGVSLGRRPLMGLAKAGNLHLHSRGLEHLLRAVPDPERFSYEMQQAQVRLLRSQGFYSR